MKQLVGMSAKTGSRPLEENSTAMPSVSFIIPTMNSESTIRSCLESIFQQHYPSFEVIIVDGGSVDDTLKIVRDFSVQLIEVKGTLGLARQIGVERASGEICAFIDSDCVLESDTWLVSIVRYMMAKRRENKGIVGAWTLGTYRRALPAALRYAILTGPREPPSIVTPHDYFPVGTGHTLLFTNDIKRVGGFNKNMHFGEDRDLLDRLLLEGYAVAYFEKTVCHLYVHNFGDLIAKYLASSKYLARTTAKKESKRPFMDRSSPLRFLQRGLFTMKFIGKDRDPVWILHPILLLIQLIAMGIYSIGYSIGILN